ncbi:alpha-L-fucosidase [bacterium]|nr:alpha-L-fucosidase [bacterium]
MSDPWNDPRTEWFREAKFGLFIHWGLYAIPAGEWKDQKATFYAEWIMKQANIASREYEPLAKQWNPVKFNAREWVGVAKAAGMKYLVITAKHHDGFSMYDTKLSDYNVVKATPWGKDPMKDLAAACREAGITFCFYYSDPDWHHPSFLRSTRRAAFTAIQVRAPIWKNTSRSCRGRCANLDQLRSHRDRGLTAGSVPRRADGGAFARAGDHRSGQVDPT